MSRKLNLNPPFLPVLTCVLSGMCRSPSCGLQGEVRLPPLPGLPGHAALPGPRRQPVPLPLQGANHSRANSRYLPGSAELSGCGSLAQWRPPLLPSLPVLAFLTPKDSSVFPKKLLNVRVDPGSLSTPKPALTTSLAQWMPPWLAILPLLTPEDSSALSLPKELKYDRVSLGLLSTPVPALATSPASWPPTMQMFCPPPLPRGWPGRRGCRWWSCAVPLCLPGKEIVRLDLYLFG